MKKLLNIKCLFAALLVLGLLVGCSGKKEEGTLSTDLVTNPKSASKPSEKQPVITFDKTEHDFGTILQGEVVSYSFHFTNTGTMPLIVSNVTTSCGCTIGDFSRAPIAPGKDGFIKASYDSKGHQGFQSRSLTVISNTNPNQNVLRLKATVQTPDQY